MIKTDYKLDEKNDLQVCVDADGELEFGIYDWDTNAIYLSKESALVLLECLTIHLKSSNELNKD